MPENEDADALAVVLDEPAPAETTVLLGAVLEEPGTCELASTDWDEAGRLVVSPLPPNVWVTGPVRTMVVVRVLEFHDVVVVPVASTCELPTETTVGPLSVKVNVVIQVLELGDAAALDGAGLLLAGGGKALLLGVVVAAYVTVVGGPRVIVVVIVLEAGSVEVGGVDVGIVLVVVVGWVADGEEGPETTIVDPAWLTIVEDVNSVAVDTTGAGVLVVLDVGLVSTTGSGELTIVLVVALTAVVVLGLQ